MRLWGGGAVSSVFGRTGAVVAATNDYNFNQLAGSVAASQMPALTGDVTTSAGSVATSIGASKVTNAMLAGSITTNKLATLSGNGGTVATTTGALTSGDCVKLDASGNFIDAGAACGSGSGGSGDLVAALVNTEVSITGAATLTNSDFAKMHVASGTTSNYTIPLPAVASNGGKLMGFRMSGALTKLVTLQGNSTELIDGQNTRVMWANESAILYCDGTSWHKIAGRSLPMIATADQSAYGGGSGQSITTGTVTVVDLDTSIDDNTGAMVDTTNDKIIIKRPGIYQISAAVNCQNLSADSARILTQVTIDVHSFSTPRPSARWAATLHPLA